MRIDQQKGVGVRVLERMQHNLLANGTFCLSFVGCFGKNFSKSGQIVENNKTCNLFVACCVGHNTQNVFQCYNNCIKKENKKVNQEIPFMFTNPQKDLMSVQFVPLMPVHGFRHLQNKANELHPDPLHPVQQALASFAQLAPSLHLPSISTKVKENDVKQCQRVGEDIYGFGEWFAVVGPGRSLSSFARRHLFSKKEITDNPSSWGWDVAAFCSHVQVLSAFAKSQKVSFSASSIKKVVGWSNSFAKGDLSLRTSDLELDLARNHAYVVYLPGHQRYLNNQGGGSTLAGARVFETKASAEKCVTRFSRLNAVIMPIEIKLNNPDLSALSSADAGIFSQALAQLRKEEIDRALLEHHNPQPQTSRKQRM